jgi:hypothetical protein
MARFAITRRLTRPEELTSFDSEGYAFAGGLSTPERLVFRRALAD